MGVSSSWHIFESLIQSLQWAMYSKINEAGMFHMLDDFFFIGPKHKHKCLRDLNQFVFVCKDIGISIKMEKNSVTNHSYNYLWERSRFQCHDM